MSRRLGFAFALLALLGAVVGLYLWALSPVGGTRVVPFRVPDSAEWEHLPAELKQRGLIRSELAASLYLVLSGAKRSPLRPGVYELSPALSTPRIFRSIARQESVLARVTFPEGRNAEWMAKRLEDAGVCSASDFLAAVRNPNRFRGSVSFELPEDSLEGYLFPDTYFFRKNYDATLVVGTMLATLERRLKQAGLRADDLHRLLTIASMVELEAKKEEERARIAGVIENRLRKGMPLQVDATVLYGMGVWKDRVTYRDLEHESPYNTYRNHGLPPGPICNPGLRSILAAARPARTKELYYVARPDGSHFFAETFEEHRRNRRLAAKERAAR